MDSNTIQVIAERFGLTLEGDAGVGNGEQLRVLKGSNMVFAGDEAAVRDFLERYGNERPERTDAEVHSYKE